MTRRPPPDRDPPGGTVGVPTDAAGWVVRAHSDQRTHEDEVVLRAWLEANPDQAAEYRAQDALWREVALLRDDEFARAALRVPPPAPPRPVLLSRRMAIGSGIAGLAAAASLALVIFSSAGGELYETAVGEQRRLQLADGSTVTLNTASRLRVRFSDGERWVELEEGQAFFQVAHDADRPFRVFVGSDEVRALGTAFEVRKFGERARVVLEQGSVAIYRAGASADVRAVPAAVLRPGQAATVDAAAPVSVAQIDLARAQAWRYGRMILDDERLGNAVAEINRYGRRRIVLADPALAELRISGVFHTARPETFVEAVTAAFPVRVAGASPDELVLGAR